MEMRLMAIAAIMITAAAVRCGGVPDDKSPEAVARWFQKLHQPPKISSMRFYLHNVFTGDGATTLPIAQANTTATSPTRFGLVRVVDSPLTVGPEVNSELIGYARGLFVFMSKEELSAAPVLTLVFSGGAYNGSTVSVLGGLPIEERYREFPIVGGTGDLRLAQGVVTVQTLVSTAETETLLFDFIFLHYC